MIPPINQACNAPAKPQFQLQEISVMLFRGKATRVVLAACLTAACLVAPSRMLGQSFTASVRGNVTDQSSAAISSAKVTVTDADRGTNFTTVSDDTGRYAFTALPPGNYVLTVEAT